MEMQELSQVNVRNVGYMYLLLIYLIVCVSVCVSV